MRKVAIRLELISLIQPLVSRQHPVPGVLGEGVRYLWLNMLTAQLPSYLPVLALRWHMP